VTPAIDERDQILRFLLEHPGFREPELAIKYYFEDGRDSAERLAGVISELRGDFQGNGRSGPPSLLEFASGYGCVTRHLGQALPNFRVVSSDIHPEAIEFIRTEIGTPAFLSTRTPEDFEPPQLFDVVFALSFFSHMPDRTWRRWLRSLRDSMTLDGVLIFTTHGLESREHFGNPQIPESGIWFEPSSEQLDLDTSEYGQTIVVSDFVVEQLDALGLQVVLHEPAYWWKHQDLYVARRRD
jgi:hypothetical protein